MDFVNPTPISTVQKRMNSKHPERLLKYESQIEAVLDQRKAIKSTNGEFVEFGKWQRANGKRGMGRSVCFSLFKIIKVIKGEIDESTLKPNELKIMDEFGSYAEKFVEYATDFIESSDISLTDGVQWYMYFLSVAERKTKHLKIARTILSIEHGKVARLENVKDEFSMDYVGKYDMIPGASTVIFFDLKNVGTKLLREVHLKVTCKNKNDEIMLGSYTSYDEQFIHSGLLVLQRIKGDLARPSLKKTSLCSYRSKPSEFEQIPEQIRKYLSLKTRNHTRVERTIPTLAELGIWLEEYEPLKGMGTRFLELPTPRIYFACPQSSSASTKEDEIISACIGRIAHDIESNPKVNLKIEQKAKSADINPDRNSSLDSLRLLKRTKYFILIVSDMKSASYALVQLGWALSTVKKILIVAKSSAISDRIKSMKIVANIQVCTYKSIISSKDEIYNDIKLFLGLD